MKVAEEIRNVIKNIPESRPFGYAELGLAKNNFFSAAKALERLQKKGAIKKISKGLFYIPRKTVFGELGPDSSGILERYLFENGKRVGYETGFTLYNKLGLTTQMAFKTKIATQKNTFQTNLGALQLSSAKSYAAITEKNHHLLGYLDVLKDIKKIPDCSVSQATKRMSFLLKELNSNEQQEIVQCALFYPARARALLGAILENLNLNINLMELKNSLNPLTKINLNIKETELPTIKNWNIE